MIKRQRIYFKTGFGCGNHFLGIAVVTVVTVDAAVATVVTVVAGVEVAAVAVATTHFCPSSCCQICVFPGSNILGPGSNLSCRVTKTFISFRFISVRHLLNHCKVNEIETGLKHCFIGISRVQHFHPTVA